jgi:hypothetical protein
MMTVFPLQVAAGCPEGYYNTKLGVCLPTSKTATDIINPLPDLKSVVDGLKDGDVKEIYKGLAE